MTEETISKSPLRLKSLDERGSMELRYSAHLKTHFSKNKNSITMSNKIPRRGGAIVFGLCRLPHYFGVHRMSDKWIVDVVRKYAVPEIWDVMDVILHIRKYRMLPKSFVLMSHRLSKSSLKPNKRIRGRYSLSKKMP